MKTIHKKIFCLLLCICISISVTGCKNNPLNQEQACLELVDCPSTTLDNVWYNPGGIFRCAVFESLLIPNADMTSLQPALAKDYTSSQDELTYVFTLHENVKWHDGEVFDAKDVVFSFKTAYRTEEINGLFSSAFQHIEGAEQYISGESEEISGILVDGNTITFRLTSPNANFLDAIAQFAILPEHILKDVEPTQLATHDYWKKPIGCGCYQITEAVENEYFILEAFDDYYGSKPGIKKLRLRLNVTDYVSEMKNEQLDFYITNDPEEISELKGLENCSEHQLNILFPTYLIMNLTEDEGVNAYLKDVRVRKALLLAIDRNAIVNAVFPGSSVTDTLIPSWDNQYLTDGEVYTYNPEKARALLEEAGFDFSQPIRLRYSTKGQSTEDLMNSIAVYWRAIGINVDLAKFDGSGSEHMFNIRDFDVCYKRLSAFNHSSVYEEVDGEGIMQTALFNQPVYDELLSRLATTRDETVRKDLIQQMQITDQEYLLRIPLFALANIAYKNDSRFSMPEAYGNLWYRYNLDFKEWKMVDKE